MKGKKLIAGLIVLLFFGTFSMAGADTILFPVIAMNSPNVVTIVSVVNRVNADSNILCGGGGCVSPSPAYLRYIYRWKDTFTDGSTPNTTGACDISLRLTPTHDKDLVSFDASDYFKGGNALFNDPDIYPSVCTKINCDNWNPLQPLGLSVAKPVRGYLLVSHVDTEKNRVDTGAATSLYGEAIIMDIVGGAAWGYVAINDKNREDYNFTHDGTASALSPKVVYTGGFPPIRTYIDRRSFTFFPPAAPESWYTRFFVTPIGDNMDSANLYGAIRISSGNGPYTGIVNGGIYDRGGNVVGASVSQSVTCTGAIDLPSLLDATAMAAVQNTGGWGFLYNDSTDNSVIVYKLEYVANSPTYGGTNNNGYCLSCTPY